MQHWRNHVGEVVHRVQHQFVGLVVVAQLRVSHHLADEKVIQVAGKVINQAEAEEIAGVAADFVQALPPGPPGHGRPGGKVVPAKEEGGVQDGLAHQRIVFEAQQRQADTHRAGDKAGAQGAQRHLLELFPLEQQSIGDNVERGEKQLEGEQHAHRHQRLVSVKIGHGEGEQHKGAHQPQSQPQREGEEAADIVPAQLFVLDDAGPQAHIGQQAEEDGENRGDGHDAIVFRHQDTGQRRIEQHAQNERGVAGGGIQVNRVFDGGGGHGVSGSSGSGAHPWNGCSPLISFFLFWRGGGKPGL